MSRTEANRIVTSQNTTPSWYGERRRVITAEDSTP